MWQQCNVCVSCVVCVWRGYGYVEYESMEMANAAVSRMNNVFFHGSYLQVSWVSNDSCACMWDFDLTLLIVLSRNSVFRPLQSAASLSLIVCYMQVFQPSLMAFPVTSVCIPVTICLSMCPVWTQGNSPPHYLFTSPLPSSSAQLLFTFYSTFW